uniref:NADP-dependent oxidoreductase domain-containing protein n=1 Tax=Maylandia zebra TaxID=106582 RepID=A0A3P9DKQ2_9CICH
MELTASHSIPLSDGNSIPLIGLGTYTPKGTAYESVKIAIETGYRHIDGALIYYNEHEVGQAIRDKITDGTVKREDIFYCGKVCKAYFLVRPTLEKTLTTLQLDYVDLYIIGLPMAFKVCTHFNVDYIVYYCAFLCLSQALEACKDAGLVKSLGVSNFNKRQLELILNNRKYKYSNLGNVECHPYFTQQNWLEYCRQNGIVIVGYSPLGTSRDPSWYDDLLVSIAKKYNKTTAQVCLRFNVQRGVVVIPRAQPCSHKENFEIFDFSLSDADMKATHRNWKQVDVIAHKRASGHLFTNRCRPSARQLQLIQLERHFSLKKPPHLCQFSHRLANN